MVLKQKNQATLDFKLEERIGFEPTALRFCKPFLWTLTYKKLKKKTRKTTPICELEVENKTYYGKL